MNVTKSECLKCGACGNMYPDNEFGKIHADECCQCTVKGCKIMPEYSGEGMTCKFHILEKYLPSAKKHMEDSKTTYERALEDYEKMK